LSIGAAPDAIKSRAGHTEQGMQAVSRTGAEGMGRVTDCDDTAARSGDERQSLTADLSSGNRYRMICPRYGAGPQTAIIAGVAVWVMAHLWSGIYLGMGFYGLITTKLAFLPIAWGLMEGAASARSSEGGSSENRGEFASRETRPAQMQAQPVGEAEPPQRVIVRWTVEARFEILSKPCRGPRGLP
jgi:hypothetical protein